MYITDSTYHSRLSKHSIAICMNDAKTTLYAEQSAKGKALSVAVASEATFL